MKKRILAACSVVTKHVLEEYFVMRRSFLLYGNVADRWHVRCDRESAHAIQATYPDTSIEVFAETAPDYDSQWSLEFRQIVEQKMHTIGDCWHKWQCSGVLFLDADLVFIGRVTPDLSHVTTDVLLTPHYWGSDKDSRSQRYGYFNSGFVFTRNRAFNDWWLQSFLSHPLEFTDQWCLNIASKKFSIARAPKTWNVGYWRREDDWDIPTLSYRTRFYHAHVFALPHLTNSYECGQKDFVLETLDFLRRRDRRADRVLLDQILTSANGIYYRHALNQEFEVLTQTDLNRFGRLAQLRKSVPRQIRIVCAVNGCIRGKVRASSEKLANTMVVPSPGTVPHPTNRLRNVALEHSRGKLLCFVDIDFVLQRGFWYLLFTRYHDHLLEGRFVCPAPLWSKTGAYFKGDPRNEEQCAEIERHFPPVGWDTAQNATLFKFHDRWLPKIAVGPNAVGMDITDRIREARFSAHPPEPWGVLRRDRCVLADEDFHGRSFDKQQFISALVDHAVQFHYAPDIFTFHNHHPDTSSPASRPERGLNTTLWLRRYASKSAKFLHLCRNYPEDIQLARAIVAHSLRTSAVDTWSKPLADNVVLINGDRESALRRTLEACHQQQMHVTAAIKFDCALAGYGYRIYSAIENPVDRWIASTLQRVSLVRRSQKETEYQLHADLERYPPKDETLIAHFAGSSRSILHAVDNLQHFSFLIDLSHGLTANAAASGLLAKRVDISGIMLSTRTVPTAVRAQISKLVASDLDFYRFVKSRPWFGGARLSERKTR
jgi:hypothetical protein